MELKYNRMYNCHFCFSGLNNHCERAPIYVLYTNYYKTHSIQNIAFVLQVYVTPW